MLQEVELDMPSEELEKSISPLDLQKIQDLGQKLATQLNMTPHTAAQYLSANPSSYSQALTRGFDPISELHNITDDLNSISAGMGAFEGVLPKHLEAKTFEIALTTGNEAEMPKIFGGGGDFLDAIVELGEGLNSSIDEILDLGDSFSSPEPLMASANMAAKELQL